MKNGSFKCWWALAVIALFLGLGQSNQAFGQASCGINFTGPAGNVLTSFIDLYPNYPNCNATFNTVVQNTNQPLPLGTYLTWCVDAGVQIDPSQGYTVPGTIYTGELFSTCDTNLNNELPPNHTPTMYVSPAVWQQVNYLLNHKIGTNFWNIQVAINDLVGGPAPSSPGYPAFDPSVVQALLTAASNNAASWSPQCGSVVGAIYVIQQQAGTVLTNAVQLLMIEVPFCEVSFTQYPTNLSLGCNPAASSIPDVNLASVTATSCCGNPVTITGTKSQITAGCNTSYRYLIYTASDNYGNTATYTQTITWTVDTNAPTITSAPAGGSLGCNPATLPTDASIKAQVKAADNCTLTNIYVTHSDMTNGCTYYRVFFINATDECGNTSPWTTVTYGWTVDTTAPTITSAPAGGSLGCNPTNLPTDASFKALVKVMDDCTLTNVYVTHSDTTNGCIFYRIFLVNASDECGNTSPWTTTVYSWTNGVPSAIVCVKGPTNGVCQSQGTYTCCITNTGTCGFSACTVSACGQNFSCPALSPGKGCSFPVNYTYQVGDCGLFNCKAVATCITTNSCTPSCSVQGSCGTTVVGVPGCKVWVCGPTNGICQTPGQYTCCITNTGTCGFCGGTVSACGQTFPCPTLNPGQGCSIPVNYTWQIADCGSFNCQAVANCTCTNSSSPTCSAQGACSTKVCGVPNCGVTVKGSTWGFLFFPTTYTCGVTNTGTACFSACKLTACGQSFNCPTLNPGQGCAVQVTHTFSWPDLFSGFTCQAVANCSCTNATSPSCTGQGTCSTWISN
jgi:hypothetical protein